MKKINALHENVICKIVFLLY